MEEKSVDVKHVRLSRDTTSSDEEDNAVDQHIPSRKIVILGDSEAGKTSLLIRFDQNKFEGADISSTVGVGYSNKVVAVDKEKVKLQIWDTAGQERFRSITRSYYRGAEGMLLVYDVTRRDSFQSIREWMTEIGEHTEQPVSLIIIGNKCDLTFRREVPKSEAEQLASSYSVQHFETSAKDGDNVDEAFLALARLTLSKKDQPTDESPTITLPKHAPKSKCNCAI